MPRDRPELLDYAAITEDVNAIELIVGDVARATTRPFYLDTPVYPARETDTLLQIIGEVRQEKSDLPAAYRLVFADLEQRIRTDHSRATMNVAASAMLALATPRLSPFLLEYLVAPAYQKDNKPEIAKALLEEAARWAR